MRVIVWMPNHLVLARSDTIFFTFFVTFFIRDQVTYLTSRFVRDDRLGLINKSETPTLVNMTSTAAGAAGCQPRTDGPPPAPRAAPAPRSLNTELARNNPGYFDRRTRGAKRRTHRRRTSTLLWRVHRRPPPAARAALVYDPDEGRSAP
ncbi:hypothetical protein EVAR_75230_1 [Eumeta japonica]|uniref:Uncharacterized protein n=1 Tax=Eumeta variegata TaxID=151549 RepID=A0A4C1V831_EUMVA|nr:hypothetical protein EVAR_75230_1 [Eumeta japonica]